MDRGYSNRHVSLWFRWYRVFWRVPYKTRPSFQRIQYARTSIPDVYGCRAHNPWATRALMERKRVFFWSIPALWRSRYSARTKLTYQGDNSRNSEEKKYRGWKFKECLFVVRTIIQIELEWFERLKFRDSKYGSETIRIFCSPKLHELFHRSSTIMKFGLIPNSIAWQRERNS